jgi:hypothetical protein
MEVKTIFTFIVFIPAEFLLFSMVKILAKRHSGLRAAIIDRLITSLFKSSGPNSLSSNVDENRCAML